jgi:LPXTG-motif cell wall-anchored protein
VSRSLRRSLSALSAVGIAVVAPLAVAGTAHAAAAKKCGSVTVEYKVDGGSKWVTEGRLQQPSTKISVRLSDDSHPGEGCEYDVSLASYNTQGSTWATSGTQTFLGWDTTTLGKSKREAKLDVSSHAPTCFGQIDLYGNDRKHDGVSAPLPKYPNATFPDDLITAWNGGKACTPTPTASPSATPTVKPSASPSASASPSVTASPSATVSPSATATASPSATATASESPSASASPSVTASPSATVSPSATGSATAAPSASATSAAPAPVVDAAGPVGTPTVAPVSETPSENLASTGGNSTQTTAIAAGGAALLALGGGAVFLGRRRARRS